MSENWTWVGRLDDIPQLGARTVMSSAGEIAIFRTREDEIFAVHNRCPHRGGPLSEGIVSGRVVVCPLHGWTIDLTSGEATAPDKGCTRTVPVKMDAEGVWLAVETRKRQAS